MQGAFNIRTSACEPELVRLYRKSSMIRLFAALPIPPEIAEGLARRQEGVPGARWSSAENLHLTLRFFGELPEMTAADLDEALAAVGGGGFDVELAGVGAFGEAQDVRSLWAGVTPSSALTQLAKRCETAARRCGLKPETRVFRPHVTLAYLKRAPAPKVAAWVQDHNLLRSPSWRATWFGLYSSWRSEDGSRYELERTYPLI
jgi:2'-5' RNA ligase